MALWGYSAVHTERRDLSPDDFSRDPLRNVILGSATREKERKRKGRNAESEMLPQRWLVIFSLFTPIRVSILCVRLFFLVDAVLSRAFPPTPTLFFGFRVSFFAFFPSTSGSSSLFCAEQSAARGNIGLGRIGRTFVCRVWCTENYLLRFVEGFFACQHGFAVK